MLGHHEQPTAKFSRHSGAVVSGIDEIERARSALFSLDASMPRDEWIRVGMAAKSAGLSGADFNEWSNAASNYKSEKDCETAWRSFDTNGRITAATLFGMAREQGWQDQTSVRAQVLSPRGSERERQIALPPAATASLPVPVTESAKAMVVWERCAQAPVDHPYVTKKAGRSDELRVYPFDAPKLTIQGQDVAGFLVVPCWSGDKLQTLQFIPCTGPKLNLAGASFSDGYFTVGEIYARSTVYVVEGIGQAWACNAATGAPSVVCFGAGRMATVATSLRATNPTAQIVLVPDRGKEEQVQNIAKKLHCAWCKMPGGVADNYDANDLMQEKGLAALADLLSQVKTVPMRYNMLSGGDLLALPAMRWMLRGVLPMTGFAGLYGPSGSGKSFLVLAIAAAIAGGEYEWFGHRVTQCPVTYCALEGEGGIAKRIKAWAIAHGKEVPHAMRFITQPFDLRAEQDVIDLASAIVAVGGAGGMTILDTLNRAAPGADENSSVDMGDLINASKRLQDLTGGLVLLVHHTGKVEQYGPRGHSSFYAALDGAIEVKCKDNVRKWAVAKSKDDETGTEHVFKLDVVTVGVDDDGDDVTSCVVVPDATMAAIKKMTFPSGANQKIAFDMLAAPMRESVDVSKGGAPEGQGCITFQAAMDLVASCMPGDAKHKRQRAKEAITALITKSTYGLGGGWIWAV
jgi:putative DNA primase/helicase